MKSLRRALLAACAIVAGNFLMVAPGHAQAPKVRFTLDWVVQGQHAPFLLAKGKGYFDQEGVDVTVDVGNENRIFKRHRTPQERA